jgi:hypothetical protein
MWRVLQVSKTEVHVYPENDMVAHVLTDKCKCNPTVKPLPMGRMVVHNSFDGRETSEQATAQEARQ